LRPSNGTKTAQPTWRKCRGAYRPDAHPAGDLIYKPRGQWHTFWNATDEPASILEIISPAGFEKYFEDLIGLVAAGRPDPTVMGAIAVRYGLERDVSTIPALYAKYGLTFP
jgi:hypothetical protein